LKLFEGVIRGIPHDCLIIVVSNSSRYPLDRYRLERDILKHHTLLTDRDAIIIHQKDRALADNLRAFGYHYILSEDLARDGKGEAMIIGTLLAKAMNKEYVGFIDADNYIPGAVNEYVKIYASAMAMSDSPYTMARIAWKYKSKINESYFTKWGRVSEYTNKYLNMLVSSITGFGTDIVKTGNSGEHVMSMKLAEIMNFSSQYSIEPYELVYLIEEFGGLYESEYKDAINEGVNIMQIESINPHIHEDKGLTHINEMLNSSLASIYFSKISTEPIKKSIINELKKLKSIKSVNDIKPINIMSPIKYLNCYELFNILKSNSSTLDYFGSNIISQINM
jgi:mannosyl-3-phosphoglycerate synthase